MRSTIPEKPNLFDFTLSEMQDYLVTLNQPRYRGRQVFAWLYEHLVSDFEAMTNLPRGLRQQLAELAVLTGAQPLAEQVATDGLTIKALLGFPDGETVETVLMRYPAEVGEGERRSVCVSSQVGCAIGCSFCATGRGGFVRQLRPGEIVGQVLHFAKNIARAELARPITNVVFMGQGEPLLNAQNVRTAIEILNDPAGFNLGARHMTISTAGVIPGIAALAEWPFQVGLAVSLHAADDATRSRLVPLNHHYGLDALIAACRRYVEHTGRRVTFEYAMIADINDEPSQARLLAQRLRGLNCHVNLIPLNATPDCDLRPAPRSRVLAFQGELTDRGIPCTVRAERGADIDAACGQLRRRLASD
ncbi:MAG: 23S rRNA (adenine(2503)-C(2))-methyltransferase RlmN [Chloroflexota bacterium]